MAPEGETWPDPRWTRHGLWGSLAFLLMLAALEVKGVLFPLDRAVDAWVQRLPAWNGVGYLSVWGSSYATVPVSIATVMALLAMGARRSAVVVTAVGALGGWAILALQVLFRHVTRSWGAPLRALVVFPSGHAAGATMAWGFAALFTVRVARRLGAPMPGWVPQLLVATWAAVDLAVGLDRLLVRSHVLTDILAGWALGVALLCGAIMADGRWGTSAIRPAPPNPPADSPVP
jgi:undecaprenyl-diphosphatase